jgi:Protein kinase domain
VHEVNDMGFQCLHLSHRNQPVEVCGECGLQGGDLRSLLLREKPAPLTWWNGGKQVAMDVARGLVFLHTHKVVHRDLKTSNILISAVRSSLELPKTRQFSPFALYNRYASPPCSLLLFHLLPQ